MKVALLNFRTTAEMKDYIATNKDLSDLLKQQKIKLRKANSIIYQKQQYIDNTETIHDVTEIIKYVQQNIPAVMQWSDSTECLTVKGNIEYKNDSLHVKVTDRQFDNEIAIVGGWERDQRNLWTRWFGRKKATVTATSKCGKTETLVIEKGRE